MGQSIWDDEEEQDEDDRYMDCMCIDENNMVVAEYTQEQAVRIQMLLDEDRNPYRIQLRYTHQEQDLMLQFQKSSYSSLTPYPITTSTGRNMNSTLLCLNLFICLTIEAARTTTCSDSIISLKLLTLSSIFPLFVHHFTTHDEYTVPAPLNLLLVLIAFKAIIQFSLEVNSCIVTV
jgi:hypothetical protein